MSRIVDYPSPQRPHFEIGAPSTLSRLGPGLFKVAALVSVIALAYFALKALMKYSSERELRVPGAEGAPPEAQDPSDLASSKEWITYFVVTARYNIKGFEKDYLLSMTDEQEKFGNQFDSMKDDLFLQLKNERLLDEVHKNCTPMGILYEAIREFKEKDPELSAPPQWSQPVPIFYPGPE